MPKVSKSKFIERKGVEHVRSIFSEWEWIFEEFEQDFGEDIFVTVPIEDEIGSQNSFRVQVKTTESPIYGLDGNLRFSISRDHLQKWVDLEVPVFIVVVDKTDIVKKSYWLMVDEKIEAVLNEKESENITLSFPFRNRLEFDQSKYKISLLIFLFFQEGYDLTSPRGKKVKQIVEKNIEFLLSEVPEISLEIVEDNVNFPWGDLISEFLMLLDWLKKHNISTWPISWDISLAYLYLLAHELEISLELFLMLEKEETNDKDDFDILNGLGITFIELYQYTEALNVFSKLLERHPEDSWVWFHKGVIERRVGDPLNAINSHKMALMINPKMLNSYASTGGCYRDLKEPNKALEYAHKALLINPEYIPALLVYASSLKDLKRYEESEIYYKRILKCIDFINTDEGIVTLTGYGSVLRKLGKLEEAKNVYEQALSIRPKNEYTLTGYGWVFYDLKDFNNAKMAFKKALNLNPESKYAKFGLDKVSS